MKKNGTEIAIVGMAARLPDAPNVSAFWQNLKNGVESIRPLTDSELLAAGVSREELAQPEYVKSGVVLKDLDMFDAKFFGFSPKDAAIMDPQHRIFLECAWESLENAGHVPENFAGSIGVYAGSGMNSYMIHNLLTNRTLMENTGLFLIRQTGNDKDVLATRISYELDLRGPSVSVQTACSTSLVAVHLACQSLLNHECDMALAGGVTIEFPHGRGYLYREGEILSRDGHCRVFDAESSGTVFSSGAGIVVLRRLEDALADHDTVHAIILGSAVNNDGARKAGYLAPSVDGQAEVIAEAMSVAEVKPQDISYVETHGTGTKVGDPIEIRALTKAFRHGTQDTGFCAIGSLKSNIGHLDAAAGITGLIKTVLAMKHRQIPPSLHFDKPNPLIDFASSPFYVNTELAEWKAVSGPRRAGVTSLGIGGTNVHVVLEEALPAEEQGGTKKPYQLIVLSAKTESALEQASRNLALYLQEHPDVPLRDGAYTCQTGRKAFAYRRSIVAATPEETGQLLANPAPGRISSAQAATVVPGTVFMFSGQGSQYVNMGRELYETEPLFRDQLDFCAERVAKDLGLDLRTLLYPPEQESAMAAENLSRTCFTQPALFAIEYALAQWWIAHGISPVAMIGHSIGEYVAACVAEVFSLEDGIHLTAVRGRLMDAMPRGSMLSVAASPDGIQIPKALSIAAVNGPEQCVVSGSTGAVQEFAQALEKQGIVSRALRTSHAFHSAMMDPMLESFLAEVAKVSLCAPKVPYISNLTGTWITTEQAKSPDYWVKHLRSTVQFSGGLAELFRDPSCVFLEIGPGQALTSLTRQHPAKPKSTRVLGSMRHPQDHISDAAFLLNTAGQLWTSGCVINWNALYDGSTPSRTPLPTYPFERQRYWIEPGARAVVESGTNTASGSDTREIESMFQKRVWTRFPLKQAGPSLACWLVLLDEMGLGLEICKLLKAAGHEVLQVSLGTRYRRTGTGMYTVRAGDRRDYVQLLSDIAKNEHLPSKILHLWPVIGKNTNHSLDETLDLSFYSLLFLAQALGEQDLQAVEITSVSNGLYSVSTETVFEPARATLLGPIRVVPKELPGILCRSVDIDWQIRDLERAASQILSDCALPIADTCIAWRDSERWVESFEATTLRSQPSQPPLKEKGVYWITGGLGGIGMALAEHLARKVRARLVLTSRTALPSPSQWDAILAQAEKSDAVQQTIKKLRELESIGSEVLTIAADVTDRKRMEEALQAIEKRFGKLSGVIHAAGLIEDGPLQVKTRESAARVLAPKIQGTLVLQDVLRGRNLDFLLLFSSISALTPPPGQLDYAAANAFLDAFAQIQTGQPTTAVNWSLWTDIGMASRDSIGSHQILGRRVFQSNSESVCSTRLNRETNWLVSEHRLKSGEALLPGTGYLQLAAAALAHDRFESGVQFEDVFFLAPLSVASTETKELRVRLRRQRSGFRFSILAKDQEWVEYASGQVARNQNTIPPSQQIDEIRARCSRRCIEFDDQYRTRQEQYFDFGPRWRNLRKLQIGEREALAELRLGPEFSADFNTWFLHPALLDMATGSALYLIENYEDSQFLYLPLSYKRIAFYRPLPARFFSHIRSRKENTSQREIATFNLTLLDPEGKVLAEIEEFSLRRIAVPAESPLPILRPRTTATYGEPTNATLEQGISSEEGIEAFDKILSSDMPRNVIVARRGLTLVSPKSQPPSPLPGPTRGETESKGEVESVLSEWWQELLGIENVGFDDDFFDLGGHSLIALRLFNKIKKRFEVDLGLSTLFEARTIRRLGALIREAAASTGGKRVGSNTVVAIQEQGPRLPLFLISGLGGEVIGFHNLARCLGDDQPVFALQPQGLEGKRPYLTRVEDMAASYIREIRSIQHHGPYCLAGYSFGGYVIFEMAQQLRNSGEEVALLGLLDTIEWRYLEQIRHSAAFRERWARRLDRLTKGGWNYVTGIITSRVTAMMYRLFHLLGRPVPQRVSTLQDINRFAMSLYRPTVYPGSLTIFRSVTRSVEAVPDNDESLGWGGLVAGGIEVQDVTGTHDNMLNEPNVRVLAEKLRLCLDRVQIPLQNDSSFAMTDPPLEPVSILK